MIQRMHFSVRAIRKPGTQDLASADVLEVGGVVVQR